MTKSNKKNKRNRGKGKVGRTLLCNLWGEPNAPFLTKNYPPGQHGPKNQRKESDYGKQLRAKQRLKKYYGKVNERQFRNTFKEASRLRGDTGENLVGLLERRLDIIVYRLNIAKSVYAARQLVSHKHIKVNGRPANIPSMQLKIGDVIEVKDKSKEIPVILEAVQKLERSLPDYLEFDQKSVSGKLIRIPILSDVPYPVVMEPNLVIELYSR